MKQNLIKSRALFIMLLNYKLNEILSQLNKIIENFYLQLATNILPTLTT